MANDKDYDKSVLALYEDKNGNYYSLTVDERTLENFQAMTAGTRVFIRRLSEDQREKMRARNGKKPPSAFIDVRSAERVASEDAEFRAKRAPATPPTTEDVL